MESLDFGLLEGILTSVIVVLGSVIYKFWSTYKEHKTEIEKKKLKLDSDNTNSTQSIIKDMYDKVQKDMNTQLEVYRNEIIEYKLKHEQETLEYKKEIKEYREQNTDLTKKLAEAIAKTVIQDKQIQLLEHQVKQLELEVDRLRKRIASQSGSSVCPKCETPKRCGYGMDCPYEV